MFVNCDNFDRSEGKYNVIEFSDFRAKQVDSLESNFYLIDRNRHEGLKVRFENCSFDGVDFDRFGKTFEGVKVSFRSCNFDRTVMSGRFAKEAEIGEHCILFDARFKDMKITGNNASFTRVTFEGCDLSAVYFGHFADCEGIAKSRIVRRENLVTKVSSREDGGRNETRTLYAKDMKKIADYSIASLLKDNRAVILQEAELDDFYKANKEVFKKAVLDTVVKFDRDMIGDRDEVWNEQFRQMRNAVGNVEGMDRISYFCSSGGVMLSGGKVAYRDTFLELGHLDNEMFHKARFELADEKKIKEDENSIYVATDNAKPKRKKVRKHVNAKENEGIVM